VTAKSSGKSAAGQSLALVRAAKDTRFVLAVKKIDQNENRIILTILYQ
jgi:hypothetical protein